VGRLRSMCHVRLVSCLSVGHHRPHLFAGAVARADGQREPRPLLWARCPPRAINSGRRDRPQRLAQALARLLDGTAFGRLRSLALCVQAAATTNQYARTPAPLSEHRLQPAGKTPGLPVRRRQRRRRRRRPRPQTQQTPQTRGGQSAGRPTCPPAQPTSQPASQPAVGSVWCRTGAALRGQQRLVRVRDGRRGLERLGDLLRVEQLAQRPPPQPLHLIHAVQCSAVRPR
jgi:hypothetical protein